MQLWVTYTQSKAVGESTVDEMFKHNVRFHVVCKTQDELNVLQGYQLVYGRQLELLLWPTDVPLLPIVYSTFDPEDLRNGL